MFSLPDLKHIPPLSPLTRDLIGISLDDEDAERRLLRIADSEPQLAARLVGVANSVAYSRGGPPLLATAGAVRRIGLRQALQLSIAVLFGLPFGSRIAGRLAEDVWLHALAMAAAAQEIARLKEHRDPGAAYLAGLVHDLGYLLVELAAPGTIARCVSTALNDNLAPEQAEEKTLGLTHAQAAATLLAHWNAPAAIVEAIETHHRTDVAPDSLAAIVFGAEKLARFDEIAGALYGGRPHPFELLSIDRLGLEFLLGEQLELSPGEVAPLAQRIVDQVESFGACAGAMRGAP